MRILFIFIDGIGLGPDNPEVNPFSRAVMPNLQGLLDDKPLVSSSPSLGPIIRETKRASLISLDANLGVDGLPQSATGQATLFTGLNIPVIIGQHYGPKPSPDIKAILQENNIFRRVMDNGFSTALLNAYPPSYFDAIEASRRLPGVIAMSALLSGVKLKTVNDLFSGDAISADFTARGWRSHLGIAETPILSSVAAGERLAKLAHTYDFSVFEYWLSDYAGHRMDIDNAILLLETFDQVVGGLYTAWKDDDGLILITSDHGNMESLDTRRHTNNPVPAILIGSPQVRRRFVPGLRDLTDITPAILDYFGIE
jgi:hypothetical protein